MVNTFRAFSKKTYSIDSWTQISAVNDKYVLLENFTNLDFLNSKLEFKNVPNLGHDCSYFWEHNGLKGRGPRQHFFRQLETLSG